MAHETRNSHSGVLGRVRRERPDAVLRELLELAELLASDSHQ